MTLAGLTEAKTRDRRRLLFGSGLTIGSIAIITAVALWKTGTIGPSTATQNQPSAPNSTVNKPPPAEVAARESVGSATADAANNAPTNGVPSITVASARRTNLNPLDGGTYVWVAPGSFTLGCSPGDSECGPDEHPSFIVRIRSGFWIGRTEMTNAQAAKVSELPRPAADQRDLPTALTRGGGFMSTPSNVRASRRRQIEPDDAEPMVGLRCVLN